MKIEIDFDTLIKTEKRVRELKELHKGAEITVRVSKEKLDCFSSFGVLRDLGEALQCKISTFEGDDISR